MTFKNVLLIFHLENTSTQKIKRSIPAIQIKSTTPGILKQSISSYFLEILLRKHRTEKSKNTLSHLIEAWRN